MSDNFAVDAGTVQIGDLNIAYRRQGVGVNTLVFIHGNSGGKAAFDAQFSGLKNSGYNLLAIDLPGHGESSNSEHPEKDYNFPAFALLVKRVCEALDVKNPIVIGWSLGGHVAIEMAGRGFDMAGLVISGTPPLGPGMDDFETAFLPSEAMAVTLNPTPTDAETRVYVHGLYGSLDPVPETFFALAARMDGAVRSHMGAHWAGGDYGCHQKTVVAGWAKPICVIHGQADEFVSETFLRDIDWRNLWRDEIHFLPSIGHAPFIEDPETFNRLIGEFAADVFGRNA